MSDQQDEKEQQEAEVQQEGYGSLERATAGQFEFSISAIVNEAWERTKGNKGTLWLGMIIYMIVAGVFSFLSNHILAFAGLPVPTVPSFSSDFIIPTILSNLINILVGGPLGVGMFMLGLKIVSDEPREPTDVLNYFSYVAKIFVTYLAMYVLIILGFCLFILPGFYLMVAYTFAPLLVVEKNLNTWQALEASRKAISKVWFSFFGLGLLLILLMLVSCLPLFIGLIWALPLVMLSYSTVYRIMFGRERAVTVEA